tara:strand:+ start:140 stop:682 length:543 start_codon:yes stop_codon:yes gene_type:complete
MGGFKFTTLVMYIVLLITFLGLISRIFALHRFAFYIEFFVLLGLLLVALIGAIGINSNSRWAWILLTLLFGFIFLDMLFIYSISAVKWKLFSPAVIVTVAGFFISLFSIEGEKIEEIAEEVEEKTIKKSFTPGKYIASKTGAKFHAPKSEWGKKIKKKNAVWFNSKEYAVKAGYKPGDGV